jgi:hypothetical protein
MRIYRSDPVIAKKHQSDILPLPYKNYNTAELLYENNEQVKEIYKLFIQNQELQNELDKIKSSNEEYQNIIEAVSEENDNAKHQLNIEKIVNQEKMRNLYDEKAEELKTLKLMNSELQKEIRDLTKINNIKDSIIKLNEEEIKDLKENLYRKDNDIIDGEYYFKWYHGRILTNCPNLETILLRKAKERFPIQNIPDMTEHDRKIISECSTLTEWFRCASKNTNNLSINYDILLELFKGLNIIITKWESNDFMGFYRGHGIQDASYIYQEGMKGGLAISNDFQFSFEMSKYKLIFFKVGSDHNDNIPDTPYRLYKEMKISQGWFLHACYD